MTRNASAVFLAGSFIVLMTGTAAALEPGIERPDRSRRLFQRCDRNHDGVIDEREFDRALGRLQRLRGGTVGPEQRFQDWQPGPETRQAPQPPGEAENKETGPCDTGRRMPEAARQALKRILPELHEHINRSIEEAVDRSGARLMCELDHRVPPLVQDAVEPATDQTRRELAPRVRRMVEDAAGRVGDEIRREGEDRLRDAMQSSTKRMLREDDKRLPRLAHRLVKKFWRGRRSQIREMIDEAVDRAMPRPPTPMSPHHAPPPAPPDQPLPPDEPYPPDQPFAPPHPNPAGDDPRHPPAGPEPPPDVRPGQPEDQPGGSPSAMDSPDWRSPGQAVQNRPVGSRPRDHRTSVVGDEGSRNHRLGEPEPRRPAWRRLRDRLAQHPAADALRQIRDVSAGELKRLGDTAHVPVELPCGEDEFEMPRAQHSEPAASAAK